MIMNLFEDLTLTIWKRQGFWYGKIEASPKDTPGVEVTYQCCFGKEPPFENGFREHMEGLLVESLRKSILEVTDHGTHSK